MFHAEDINMFVAIPYLQNGEFTYSVYDTFMKHRKYISIHF